MSASCLKPSAWALVALVLGGCAPIEGPSVMALPGTGRGFEQFRVDDSGCRAYAYQQTGGVSPGEAAVGTAVASAAIGTGLGAAVGSIARGGHATSAGAATGLAIGGLSGVGYGAAAGNAVQRRYDNAYVQCMYGKGHRVPIHGTMAGSSAPADMGYAAPTGDYVPAPPSGRPPPPPPDAY